MAEEGLSALTLELTSLQAVHPVTNDSYVVRRTQKQRIFVYPAEINLEGPVLPPREYIKPRPKKYLIRQRQRFLWMVAILHTAVELDAVAYPSVDELNTA